MTHFLSRCIAPCLVTLALASTVSAWALPPVTGKVILTLSGKIEEKNSGSNAVFDLPMLEKLPQQTFTTKTPWDKQPTKFTGPLLRDVLAAAKAKGTTIKALALNDYKTAIPFEDAEKYDMILALKINGELIPVRTKGPLFIVYPFDSKPELQSVRYFERSAWQLKSLDIE
jgi:hypothetical protein